MPLRSKLIIYAVAMLLLFTGVTVGAYLSLSAASREAEDAREELAKLSLLETLESQCTLLGAVPDAKRCRETRTALLELREREWRPESRALLDRIIGLTRDLEKGRRRDAIPEITRSVDRLKQATIAQVGEEVRSAQEPTHRRAVRLLVAACLAAIGGAAMFAWFYCRLVRERQVLEERVHRSEKLGAIGTLAAGIAHEINNPLATISMSAEALAERLPPDTEERLYLKAIQEETSRCRAIIGDLSDLTRGGSIDREPVDPEELCREAVRIVRRNREPATVVETEIPENLPLVSADRGKLLQVLVNLLLNALEATGGKGRVRLAARTENGNLSVRVSDDGRGIDSHLLHRIFEPFFTDSEGGVGLGLTLCHRITELHGGELRVESAGRGRGATFTLLIPLEARDDAP